MYLGVAALALQRGNPRGETFLLDCNNSPARHPSRFARGLGARLGPDPGFNYADISISVADRKEIFPEYFRIKFRYNPLRHGPLAEELRPKRPKWRNPVLIFRVLAGGERFDSSIRFLRG